MDKLKRLREVTLLIPSSALLCLFLYIILHETGHAIVLRAVGADITEFSILSAHVSYDGGTWTNTSDRWMHMNGALFPVVIAVVYMLLYRRYSFSKFYCIFSGFFVLMPIASLMAWVFIPFLYMYGRAPEGDDVYKFLYNFTFDYPACFVSIAAIILLVGCILLATRKGIIKNFIATVRQIKDGTTKY